MYGLGASLPTASKRNWSIIKNIRFGERASVETAFRSMNMSIMCFIIIWNMVDMKQEVITSLFSTHAKEFLL